MKKFNKLAIAAACVAIALPISAQTTYSGYFLDNYDYAFQMNPAFGNEKDFVSFPVIGNLNIGVKGSLHLKDVLYNVDGKTVLFTNPEVNTADAMSRFGNHNKLVANEKIDIMSAGFKKWGGYNTISLSAVVNAGVSVPKTFFELAKEGITNKTYDIKDLAIDANAYVQLAFNHSHDIKAVPGLRVGAAFKVLIGVGAVQAKFNQAELELGTNNWIARTNADIYASVGGLKYKTKVFTPEGNTGMQPYEYVSGAKVDHFYPTGFGLGFDLGAQYQYRDFKFSIAALDLGFIRYGRTQWASTNGTREFETDAYTFNVQGDADNSFKNEFKDLKDNLSKLYNLEDMGTKSYFARGLATTLNFGVDYALPCYRKLHFGLMNTTRIYGPFTSTNFRLSANIAPAKAFSADVNVAYGTYGFDFGWLLNVHAPGFNLFLGMDHTLGKLAKQGAPLSSNASLNFGINFPFN